MSTVKTHTILLFLFISVVFGLGLVKGWQANITKSVTKALPMTPHEALTIKPKALTMQGQNMTVSVGKEMENLLQIKLDKALDDIARLRQQNQILIEKLDVFSATNIRIELADNFIHAENESISNSTIPIQITEQLEDRFIAESQDLGWAISVEEAITNQYFDSPANGNELVDARCQSTLCRVEMSHTDQEAESLFWANATAVKGLSAEQMHVQRIETQEEGLKTILFVSRQGHKIYPENNL